MGTRYFMGHPHENNTECNLQAFLMTWFDWSVLLYILPHSMTFHLTKGNMGPTWH